MTIAITAVVGCCDIGITRTRVDATAMRIAAVAIGGVLLRVAVFAVAAVVARVAAIIAAVFVISPFTVLTAPTAIVAAIMIVAVVVVVAVLTAVMAIIRGGGGYSARILLTVSTVRVPELIGIGRTAETSQIGTLACRSRTRE